jgi:hypothetical protein
MNSCRGTAGPYGGGGHLPCRAGPEAGRIESTCDPEADLLELPEEVIRGALAMGDNWDRPVVTERELRSQLRGG